MAQGGRSVSCQQTLGLGLADDSIDRAIVQVQSPGHLTDHHSSHMTVLRSAPDVVDHGRHCGTLPCAG